MAFEADERCAFMAFSPSMPARVEEPDALEDGPAVSALAATGSRDAVLALYRAHHAHLRAFTQRLIGDEALAEDLTHEVFLAVPKAMASYRGECSVRSYLISIAARKAHKHIRAAARRRAAEARLAREPTPRPATPHAEAERDELAQYLVRALDELPLDQRVAFVLCEVEERTSVEVGAMLGEKDVTIRARVFHAKKKLRERMAALAAADRVNETEAQ
jgi:RNA polymerase sigma-70 factor, ECF subfamily